MNYAIIYFKNKLSDLTSTFTKEGMKLLQRYSHLRKHLIDRDEIILKQTRRSVAQQLEIIELKYLIKENFDPDFEVHDDINLENSKIRTNSNPLEAEQLGLFQSLIPN